VVLRDGLLVRLDADAELLLLEVGPVMDRVGRDRDRHVAAEPPAASFHLCRERRAEIVAESLEAFEVRRGNDDRHDLEIVPHVLQPADERLERMLEIVRGCVLRPVRPR
jgi:hypothetical protein